VPEPHRPDREFIIATNTGPEHWGWTETAKETLEKVPGSVSIQSAGLLVYRRRDVA